MSKSGMVNVKMVITEEKVLANIERVQKSINPKSKRQIVQFEEDTDFKDLIQSIKDYLTEYPNKKNFPINVYNAAFGLVEYATNQFESATKEIEELIVKRENNIALAGKLKKSLEMVQKKETGWKEATKQIEAKIVNLESNMFLEIDMERIEDRSKALSYIGLEIAESLKDIPAPAETENDEQLEAEQAQYIEETRVEVKPSIWQKFKNTKLIRVIRCLMKAKIVLEIPALPEGTQK